jgi:hypothetical protein
VRRKGSLERLKRKVKVIMAKIKVKSMVPKPPPLDPDKNDAMQSRGVDSMRSLLSRHDVGMQRNDRIRLSDSVYFERGEIEDWLRWKAAKDARWIKTGVVAAILAALLSLAALALAIAQRLGIV